MHSGFWPGVPSGATADAEESRSASSTGFDSHGVISTAVMRPPISSCAALKASLTVSLYDARSNGIRLVDFTASRPIAFETILRSWPLDSSSNLAESVADRLPLVPKRRTSCSSLRSNDRSLDDEVDV